jgi:hypothetical protein
MLLANLQQSISHSPVIAAAQAATHEAERSESNTRKERSRDLARQAQETVHNVQETEMEALRSETEESLERAGSQIDLRGRRRRRRRGEGAAEAQPEGPPPGAGDEPGDAAGPAQHHVDITV